MGRQTLPAALLASLALTGCVGGNPEPVYVVETIACPSGDLPELYTLPPDPEREDQVASYIAKLKARHGGFAGQWRAYAESRAACLP